MEFTITKERITAVHSDGTPMGYIRFPQVRAGLVTVDQVEVHAPFRNQGVEDAMMEALLNHLASQGRKAALGCPFAQSYLQAHPQWKSLLPDSIHFTTY